MSEIKWDVSQNEFDRLKALDALVNANEETRENAWTSDDYFGSAYVGKLCLEFTHTEDPSNWYAYCNVYALGIGDGYGFTEKGGIPYALTDLNHIHVRSALHHDTLEEFQKDIEQQLWDALKHYPDIEKLAQQPLGDWE